ncbi:glycosyltransferase [Pseudomonas aeruginosa]|nr:glycosyltransferase [Pseudomonas aeruginosa]MCO1741655.1 glycosyltransferase [Pseudomonas aeruginosa]
MLIPVVLSGGAGTRLWPVSREGQPKPFMRLPDGQTLLGKTYRRAAGLLAGHGEIVTVTNREHYFQSKDQFQAARLGRHRGHFILEPTGRNTAPAIAVAALALQAEHGDAAVLVVMPADHLIRNEEAFREAVRHAARLAVAGHLVTFGVVPDAAETGFGYIELGDQLVLLDSSWHADFFPLAERLKSEGVGIVSVIYDLIPLTHPQFCDAGLVKVFNHWFDWIAATADGYVAISETIRDEVRAEMLRRIGPEKVAQRWFDYFHLGSELDLVEDGASVEPDLLRMFKAKAPVFLMVSTIEPRKNHGYLLDAFERAWAQGSQVRLCIAGRIGWKCEALVERVRQHPELNKRLFMFNDLSDKSLEYAYSHAASLVFPSYVEGFGLPLVEAMQRGLPAMGSDIPVFREIGGEFMAYFDLADPQTLANLVTRFEATGEFPAERPVGEWRWIGWHEASRQLIARILLALGKAPTHGEAVHADCG